MFEVVMTKEQRIKNLVIEAQKRLAENIQWLRIKKQDGPEKAFTEAGTAYTSYNIGGIKREGYPDNVYVVEDVDKAVSLFLDMLNKVVKEEKAKGRETMVIRAFPAIRFETLENGYTQFSIGARLAFE
jgi:hypothetical protein